jgi:hypothetical protein
VILIQYIAGASTKATKIGKLIFLFLVTLFLLLGGGCQLFDTTDIVNPSDDMTTDSVVDDLQSIVVLCNSPSTGLDPDIRRRLVGQIESAETAYLSVEPCSAIDILEGYLEDVSIVRESNSSAYLQLYELGQSAISNIRLNQDCEEFSTLTLIPE